MKSVRLGQSGLKVSPICLGTMTFGGQCDEPTSRAIMDLAAESGITFIDTADAYPLGHSETGVTEEIVGRWLAGKRDAFVVATKGFGQVGPHANDRGNSRKHLLDAIDGSLRRLRIDYIDLYQIHHWDPETPIEETLGTLEDARRAGKIRYAGCSNVSAWQLMRSLWVSDAQRSVRFDCVQPRYNMLFREIESELLPAARAFGVGVIVYNPLAGGMLTGKYRRGEQPKTGTRFTLGSAAQRYQQRYWHDATINGVERLASELASRGKSLTQVAVRWVMDQPGITSAIVGASRPEQLTESVKAANAELNESDRRACDELWYSLPRQRPEL